MRVVVDSNVYISLLIGGSIAALTDHLFSEDVDLIFSERLIAEFEEKARKTKFSKYFTQEQTDALVDLLRNVGTLQQDHPRPPAICRDPDDDYLLALAKVAKAHVLLTGDKDLLVLGTHGKTRIMNARAFVKEFIA